VRLPAPQPEISKEQTSERRRCILNVDVEKERASFQAIFDGPRTTDLEHALFEDILSKGSAPNDWSAETITSAHYMRRVYEMGWHRANSQGEERKELIAQESSSAPALEALYVIRDYADERADAMLHNIVTTAIIALHRDTAADDQLIVAWRMVTPDQGNVVFLTSKEEAYRFKNADGREVRPLVFGDIGQSNKTPIAGASVGRDLLSLPKLSDDRIQTIIQPLFADGTCTEEDFAVARAIEIEVRARHALAVFSIMDALKPFATAYVPQAEHDDPNEEPKMRAFLDRNTITPCVTVGDFRRAHAAYFSSGTSDADDEQVLVPRYATNAIACAIEAEIDSQLVASGLSPIQMQRQDGHDVWEAAIAVAAPQGTQTAVAQ
jgi:hypothetical protein